MADSRRLFRGRILHCTADPGEADGSDGGVEYLEDGVLVLEGEHIAELLPFAEAEARGMHLSNCRPLGNKLIVPGFIDLHVHAYQLGMIASPGGQLLDWLQRYAFPAELRARDEEYAAAAAEVFLDEMLRQGTTSALVFATSDERATGLLFEAARRRRLRLITGKVLMDRNAPEPLCDSAGGGIDASRRLIERWHGRDRLAYALTPRFAPTSTPEQLALAGRLLEEYPGLYLQTHLSESPGEVALVRELFPEHADYLDVYDSHGLCTERSVFAHCLHLEPREILRLRETRGKLAFCPSSNLFLGSGLLDWRGLKAIGLELGMGSDVGAGTSLSMLKTLADAWKVCQLNDSLLSPLQAFYTITLGNARALGLGHAIGNLAAGSEADFLILDPDAIPVLRQRLAGVRDIRHEWFACMTLGDDRLIAETWIAGERAGYDGKA